MHARPTLSSVLFSGRMEGPVSGGRAGWLLMVVEDVVDDDAPDAEDEGGEAPVAPRGGFAQEGDAAGGEHEEEEEDGAGEDDTENDPARADAVGSSFARRQRGRGGRNHRVGR